MIPYEAFIRSCTCNVKTPEAKHHYASCPYYQLSLAQKHLDALPILIDALKKAGDCETLAKWDKARLLCCKGEQDSPKDG